MQRRIELAKGLLHHPGVLLLDEPTTGLDPGARRDLWQYLQTLRDEEHVSVLVTTHLMEEAERCDRLAIMNEGNLVALGTPAELKSEIGGDVVLLDAAHDAALLAERIRAAFTWRPPSSKTRCASNAKALTALSPKSSRLFPERSKRSQSASRPSKTFSFAAPDTSSGPNKTTRRPAQKNHSRR